MRARRDECCGDPSGGDHRSVPGGTDPAEEGYRSQTVSCIENTQGIDVAETIDAVSEEYDFVFSNGYGSALGEETFRIGHMGEHDLESVKELTDAIEDVADL